MTVNEQLSVVAVYTRW